MRCTNLILEFGSLSTSVWLFGEGGRGSHEDVKLERGDRGVRWDDDGVGGEGELWER